MHGRHVEIEGVALDGLGLSAADDAAVRELTVSGDARSCAEAISRLHEAGADSVVLQPIPGGEGEQLAQVPSLLAALR